MASMKLQHMKPYVIGIFVLFIVFFITTLPFVNLFIYSFREGDGVAGWFHIMTDKKTLAALKDTFFLVGFRAVIGICISLVIAWFIARTNILFGGMLEFLFWLAFFIPTLPLTTGWMILLDPDFGVINTWFMSLPFVDRPLLDIYSYGGITLAHLSSSTIPIQVMLLTPAFRYLPTDMEEAAKIFGANQFHVIRQISIPLILPTLCVVLIMGIIRGLETFEVEMILGIPSGIYVFSTLIYDHIRWDPPNFPTAAILASFFVIVMFLFIFVYRWIVKQREYTSITGKGFSQQRIDLGVWKYIVSAILYAFWFVLIALPIISLVIGTFMKRFGFFELEQPFSIRHWQRVWQNNELVGSIANSLIIGFSVAIIGILLYLVLAHYVLRSRNVGKGLVDLMIWVPWALSGILLGLAYLRFFVASPLSALYGTLSVLIILLVVKELPLGAQIIKGSLYQISKELEEASEVNGGTKADTLFRIIIPLLKPTLISVAVIAFVSALREIGALILLAKPGTQTMSILLFNYLAEQRYEQAAIMGVLLTFVISVVALIARRIGLNIGPR